MTMTQQFRPLVMENRNNCVLQPYFGKVDLYLDSWTEAVGNKLHVVATGLDNPQLAEFVGIHLFYFYEWQQLLDVGLISDFHAPNTIRELCGYGTDAIDVINNFHTQHLLKEEYKRGQGLAALYIYKNVTNESHG